MTLAAVAGTPGSLAASDAAASTVAASLGSVDAAEICRDPINDGPSRVEAD